MKLTQPYVRSSHLRLADQREGRGRLEVERLGHGRLVHEGRPRLSTEDLADRAVCMPQPEAVLVAEEVTLREGAERSSRAWPLHVDVEARLARVDASGIAVRRRPARGDRAHVEGVGRADLVEVVDDVDLDVAAELPGVLAGLELDPGGRSGWRRLLRGGQRGRQGEHDPWARLEAV